MKKTLGTDTRDGFIKHLRVTLDGVSFDAPVRLKRERVRSGRAPIFMQRCGIINELRPVPEPGEKKGEYMFALPGGYFMSGRS